MHLSPVLKAFGRLISLMSSEWTNHNAANRHLELPGSFFPDKCPTKIPDLKETGNILKKKGLPLKKTSIFFSDERPKIFEERENTQKAKEFLQKRKRKECLFEALRVRGEVCLQRSTLRLLHAKEVPLSTPPRPKLLHK